MSEAVLGPVVPRQRMQRRSPVSLAPDESAIPGRFDLALSTLYATVRNRLLGRRIAEATFPQLVDAATATLDTLDEEAFSRRIGEFRGRATVAALLQDRGVAADAMALVTRAAVATLDMRPYPEQHMGAYALLLGQLAEMATGEGKSLTAALAAATAALAGESVQIITVNEYLADRDAERHRPLFARLGLSVDCVRAGQTPPQRRDCYRADIVYCTNKDIVFDYLRDRVAGGAWRSARRRFAQVLYGGTRAAEPVVPALRFAIVDEADSVLIDEARTPLIISRDGDVSNLEVYREAVAVAGRLERDLDWRMDAQDRHVMLTERGRERAEELTREAGPVWHSERMREFLLVQALHGLHAYVRDRDYIVRDGKVQIVDEYTGRVLSDRSWERGLHQMMEAKEGLEITPERESIARMTYQRFFRRYERLAGMTGTAREVAGEMWAVYGLTVAVIPTHLPVQRRDLGMRMYLSPALRAEAIVARTREMRAAGRPVLIGTRSVRQSESVALALQAAGIPHVVLNARQDAGEAAIVADAGQGGRVTVATNMAGRGTDIILAEDVRARGGLHVIMTEFHDSPRIDRQLVGRGARQGDPGSHEAIVCLEDDLFRNHAAALAEWVRRRVGDRDCVPPALARALLVAVQLRAQRTHTSVRMRTLQQDYRSQRMMGFAGRGE